MDNTSLPLMAASYKTREPLHVPRPAQVWAGTLAHYLDSLLNEAGRLLPVRGQPGGLEKGARITGTVPRAPAPVQ